MSGSVGALRLARWFGWSGLTDRGTYFLVGTFLAAIKYGLDWLMATQVFHQPSWSPAHYLIVPTPVARVVDLSAEERAFYITLVALALPFIWVGLTLTVRRLRDANLPLGLSALFFAPVINLFFFAVLCLLPSRPAAVLPVPEPRFRRLRDVHARVVPDHPVLSGAAAVILAAPLGLAATLLSIQVLGTYGWGVFVGMPFCVGFGSVLLYGFQRPRGILGCLAVALAAIAFLGVGMVAFALEGAICLIMASPLAVSMSLMGGALGYVIQARPWAQQQLPLLLLALAVLLPSLMAAERAGAPRPALREVRTAVEVEAPPEQVWRSVVSFPDLAEPDEWLFRGGVAYPTRAEIQGSGPGAVRRCIFSTGTFVEPIEVWDEPRVLGFGVAEQPPPLREWSPYRIHPAHLDNYLVSHRGEFRLIALQGGRTRLEGTTWYSNKMWPEAYWQLWSDGIIHRIHRRVLEHIKARSERQAAARGPLRHGG